MNLTLRLEVEGGWKSRREDEVLPMISKVASSAILSSSRNSPSKALKGFGSQHEGPFGRQSPLAISIGNTFLIDRPPEARIKKRLRTAKRVSHLLQPHSSSACLAEEASGQFIYAGTVIRYIQDGKDTPHEQLKRVLDWKGAKSSRPFATLDALYAGILNSSSDPPLAVKWILSLGYMDRYEFWNQKAVLESSPGQTEVVLGKLTALVGLSDEHGQPAFTIYHKSLTDFLEDKGRSGDIHLEGWEVTQTKQFLRERHYQVLKNRGPQGYLPPDLQEFYRMFCQVLCSWIDYNRPYDPRDVEWWISLHGPVEHLPKKPARNAPLMFWNVHVGCHWYHCVPACRVWRKGILRHLKGILGYPVPTSLDLFKSRFPRWRRLGDIRYSRKTIKSFYVAQGIRVPSIYDSDSDDDSPVQFPIGEDSPDSEST
ncbi:hypothetical protein NMY22_g19361 [Coprinellus aureogranulatus]|nr:hypothetical protein NMY22_g19361 [Coprinellus aureogranulatus]